MADVEFDEFEDGYVSPVRGSASRLTHVLGAACSFALVVGMAVWGYKLAVRDVTGIPVVRALTEPMRVAPATPGGEEASHQGLSVNAIAAAGTVSPLPETLILAPPEIDLTADDKPGLAPSEQPAAGEAVVTSSIAAPDLPGGSEGLDPTVPLASAAAADQPVAVERVAPIEAAPVEVAPVVPAEAAVAEGADAATEALSEEDAVAAALASALGSEEGAAADAMADGIGATITKTPRPPARPAALAVAATGGAIAVAATQIDAASIPVGTRLVQLGAFDDEAAARAEWGKLQAQFPDMIAAKAMVIQPAQSGGRTFYRLRAHGFDNEDQARQFCAALLSQNASCIPVAQR